MADEPLYLPFGALHEHRILDSRLSTFGGPRASASDHQKGKQAHLLTFSSLCLSLRLVSNDPL